MICIKSLKTKQSLTLLFIHSFLHFLCIKFIKKLASHLSRCMVIIFHLYLLYLFFQSDKDYATVIFFKFLMMRLISIREYGRKNSQSGWQSHMRKQYFLSLL